MNHSLLRSVSTRRAREVTPWRQALALCSVPLEVYRRVRARSDGRLRSLPILSLSVHSACNCRCVMCDIWKANAERREISAAELARHLEAIRRLRVRRVMLTGGEPLLHSNLWALCAGLEALRIRVTLVTTGLLLGRHADAIVRHCDEIIVSLDGDRETHDAIRRVPGAFDRIEAGVAALRARSPWFPVAARCVVQKRNFAMLGAIVRAAREAAFDRISFLAADVTSEAFNRAQPWDEARQREVRLAREDLPALKTAIEDLIRDHEEDFRRGFIETRPASLRRIVAHYAALAGVNGFPEARCNAPWVSAVLEPDGTVRPCFFHAPYGRLENGTRLATVINSAQAIAFRRGLDVTRDETCRRCVCSLNLPARRPC